MVEIKIVKILAEGTNKRYMWYLTPDGTKCARIDDKTYTWLKQSGVLTAQKIRALKNNAKKLLKEIEK